MHTYEEMTHWGPTYNRLKIKKRGLIITNLLARTRSSAMQVSPRVMLCAYRAFPRAANRTRVLPQQQGLLRVVDATIVIRSTYQTTFPSTKE